MTNPVPPSLVLKSAAAANFQQVVAIGVQTDGSVKIIQSAESSGLVEQVARAVLAADAQSRNSGIPAP